MRPFGQRGAMPTLIRLVIVLLILAGLVYGAMFALVMVVDPPDKDVTIRIPARDLVPAVERAPIVLREIDTSRDPGTAPVAEPAGEAEPDPVPGSVEVPPPPSTGEGDDAVTLSPGVE